jgi:hypothetical protein
MRCYIGKFFVQGQYFFGMPGRNQVTQDFYLRAGYAFFLNNHVAIEPYAYGGYHLPGLPVPGSGLGNFSRYDWYDYGLYFSLQVYLDRQKAGVKVKDNKKGLR